MELTIPLKQINMPSDIRTVNEMRVLELFHSGQELSAADIIKKTGISKPTVMKILQQLCARGTVRTAGIGQSTSAGGKKPELFVFADERKILCINFWPGETTLSLGGIAQVPVTVEKIRHELGGDLDREILWLVKTTEEYLKKKGCAISDLYGAVITTSGTVDFHQSILRYNSQQPEWGSNVHLKGYLDQIFGTSVKYMLENAGKAAGRGYLADNPELNNHRILSLFTTWGVSGCLIENGRVLNGKDFLIGEVGHMTVSSEMKDICGCGRSGCLEQMVSMKNIRAMAQQLKAPWYKEEKQFSFEQLFYWSGKGEETARQIVRKLTHWFAVMLHNIILAYNPDVVVFQGNFARADGYFDSCLRAELGSFRYMPEESVQICYDDTPLEIQAVKGGLDMLRRTYFSTSNSSQGKELRLHTEDKAQLEASSLADRCLVN